MSFAVSRKAYQKITERFAREYEAHTGQPIKFRLSFGGSGTQVYQVQGSGMHVHQGLGLEHYQLEHYGYICTMPLCA